METWFSSDHHFGHKNVIGYCDRPYSDVEEMNEQLVTAWNEVVSSQDTVYYLGDFSLRQAVMEQYASRLNGRKILIAGNHDSCHPSNHNGQWRNRSVYLRYFDSIHDEFEWQGLLLHHMPYYDPDDDRLPEYRPIDQGKILLHGHVHQRWLRNGRQINVGVDVWDYQPVHEDEISALIRELEN